jgi:hypothetical protein
LLIKGTNVGTADSGGAGTAITEGNWSKALRAIATVGSIVFVGPRSNDGFCVAIDAATASDNGEANVATRVDTVVTAATGVATTVTVETLTLADFA